jgi:hypothetical protein
VTPTSLLPDRIVKLGRIPVDATLTLSEICCPFDSLRSLRAGHPPPFGRSGQAILPPSVAQGGRAGHLKLFLRETRTTLSAELVGIISNIRLKKERAWDGHIACRN